MSKIRERLITPSMSKPKGRFVVDLLDDRGKVRQRHESDNYVTPQLSRYLQWQQGMNAAYRHGWLASGQHYRTIPPSTNYDDTLRPVWNAWNPPWVTTDAIIATDWADAEDVTVDWLKGNTIAFATKWKASVPALGMRGQINEAENTISADLRTARWVWDWTTQQGNGTFQTLAIGGVANWNYGSLFCAQGERGIIAPNPSDVVGAQNPRLGMRGMAFDNSGDLWLAYPTSSTVLGFAKVDASAFTGMTADSNGVFELTNNTAPTVSFTKSGLLTNSGSSTSTAYYFFQGRGMLSVDPASDDLVYVQVANNGNWNVCRYTQAGATVYENKATGATAVAGLSPTVMVCSSTVVGGKIYAVVQPVVAFDPMVSMYTDASRIARFNLATGAFEAYVNLPTGHYHYGVMTDNGTDLILHTPHGLRVYNTSGANVSPFNLGIPSIRAESGSTDLDADDESQYFNGINSEDLITPHTSTDDAYGPLQASNDFFARGHKPLTDYRTVVQNTGQGFIGGGANTYYLRRDDAQGMPILLWHNDRLYWCCAAERIFANVFAPLDAITMMEITGNNMFSRTLLDSAVTKANTQNMKISYELTLPEDWLGAAPSVNPFA